MGDALSWARRGAGAAWISGVASVGLAWAQARWYAFHPHYLPLILLYFGLASTTLIALVCGAWRIIRGPARRQALAVVAAAAIPVAYWGYVGYVAHANFSQRLVPHTFAMRLAKVMGATLMRLQAEFAYPQRVESERLVMYFDPGAQGEWGKVDRPDEDLALMDRHLARLEGLLGGKIESKVFWIRGKLLGIGYASFHGLSLGSSASPGLNGTLYRGDRHELAHAALDWFRTPESDPPYVLHEGWAMAQCGADRHELAQAAAKSRTDHPPVGLRELFGPEWYHRDSGPVYSVGGAFVDYLLRMFGPAKFRRFYAECLPDQVEVKCREIYGADLADLETGFWAEVRKTLE